MHMPLAGLRRFIPAETGCFGSGWYSCNHVYPA